MVPEEAYGPSYLREEPLDESYDFISQCAGHGYHVRCAGVGRGLTAARGCEGGLTGRAFQARVGAWGQGRVGGPGAGQGHGTRARVRAWGQGWTGTGQGVRGEGGGPGAGQGHGSWARVGAGLGPGSSGPGVGLTPASHPTSSTGSSPFCRDAASSLSLFYNNGARPCGCHEMGATGPTCEPFGGQCPCRAHVIGRDCSRCATGYWGFPSCRREYLGPREWPPGSGT